MRLPRIPSWDELFQAAYAVVQSLPPGVCKVGPFHLLISDDSRDGRCPIYACLVWAVLQMILENGSGINLGRIIIKIEGPKGQGILTIPPQSREPNFISGAFHAWCILAPSLSNLANASPYIVDFGYHWFHTSSDPDVKVAGPDEFAVATPEFLHEHGVTYYADGPMSEEVTMALELDDFTDLLLDFGIELRSLMAQ